MTRVLITGACGFVGHHLVEHFLKNTDWEIVVFDRLSYASSGFDRLRDIEAFDDKRVMILTADFTAEIGNGLAKEIGDVEYILHLGANSHVDNSITNPLSFERANVLGTMYMLEFAKTVPNLKKFLYFGTDEVYGTAPVGVNYKEGDRFNPGNPYAASKAAAECFCYSYANTYKLPIIITNTMNVIGERQHPEKFVPMVIKRALSGEVVTIHSNKEKTKAGSRFYIHGRNVADAVLFILQNTDETLDNIDASKGKFNIVGEIELDNLELAQMIAKAVGKPLKYEMVDFHSSRPGHDLRYALDGSKLAKIGWKPPVDFEASLKKTVDWTLKNRRWL
ncbi:MAG: GDP-mannose 4,6-dehydratase [archaeon]